MKQLLFILLCGISFSTMAQNQLIAYRNIDKWGFLDPTGKTIISEQYKDAYAFSSEGKALVLKFNGKWTLIDKSNEEVNLPFEFKPRPSTKGMFSKKNTHIEREMIILQSGKKFAAINPKGEVIYNAEWTRISEFVGGFGIGQKDKEFYILDLKGNTTLIQGSPVAVNYVKNGYAPFRNKKKLFGFVNDKGEVVIEPQFRKVGYFYNGITWAKNTADMIGLIDTQGNWVVKPQFTKVTNIGSEDRIFTAAKGEEQLFLRENGETFSIPGAIKQGKFSEGLCWVRVGEKIGFINTKGDWVIEPQYEAVKNYEEGLARVKKNGMWGLIDKSGKNVMDHNYLKIGEMTEGLVVFRVASKKWGFADLKGNVVIEASYDNTRPFKNGYAAVRIGDLWGLIDKSGKMVIEPQYTRIKDVEIIK